MRLFLCILFILIAVNFYGLDKINDDYSETNEHAFHSYGLLTYGFHSNTFHIRNLYLRYNYTLNDIQFIATLNGYKDTHIPETNYNFILNNINLYDYGIYYKFFDHYFLSLRGAAVYRMNYDSLLLIPPFTDTNNAGEFDSPSQYLDRFLNAPGIRTGYTSDNFEMGYSQGDYRHSIPSAVMAKILFDGFYIKSVLQYEHSNPLVYDRENYNVFSQLSFGGNIKMGDWIFSGIIEGIYENHGTLWLRFEEAIGIYDFTFAIRELVLNNQPSLFEFSIKKVFYSISSLGLFASTDGRIYFGSEVNF